MERGSKREEFREAIIAFIDQWREEHPEARFIKDIEIPKVLDVVGYEYVKRHHKTREERGKNEHGEYL
jgi:hypothetical protein